MCSKSFQQSSRALLPIHVRVAPHRLGSTMCQHPYHGWHLWPSGYYSLAHGCLLLCLFTGLRPCRFSTSFCALWPEGYIFLAHTLMLSLPCLKTSCDPSVPPESSLSSLAWPFKSLASFLGSTFYPVGLWTSARAAPALYLASLPSWSA